MGRGVKLSYIVGELPLNYFCISKIPKVKSVPFYYQIQKSVPLNFQPKMIRCIAFIGKFKIKKIYVSFQSKKDF